VNFFTTVVFDGSWPVVSAFASGAFGKVMKSCVAMGFVLLCLMLAPARAMADGQNDRFACIMDAETYCSQFIPDRARVAHCLMANRRRITPACREAIRHFK
jgi:hypothetical protein